MLLSATTAYSQLREMAYEEMSSTIVLDNSFIDKGVLIVVSPIAKLSFKSTRGIKTGSVYEKEAGIWWVELDPGVNMIDIFAEGFLPIENIRHNFIKRQVWKIKVTPLTEQVNQLPVKFRVEPSGANIRIDGKTVDVSNNIVLNIAEHTIDITKSGYVTVKEKFTVSNNNIYFEYLLKKPELCVVEVSSNPSGAEVWIDGVKLSGVTPVSDFFNSGNYTIKITRDKYLSVNENITIDLERDKNSFDYKLEPNFGWLTINTNSGAAVYLNNKLASELRNIELSPQTVNIRIEKAKCSPKQTSLIIRKGARESVDLFLDEQVGTIAISVDPPDAQIELNGDAGEHYTAIGTKIFSSTPIGRYKLEVTSKGYKTDKQTLNLKSDATLRERIILE